MSHLTSNQQQTLATAIRASTDPVVVAALAIRDDVTLTNWCNSASNTDAWIENMSKPLLFEAMNITQFDGITAGKRDAWKMIMDNAPVDFSRAKMRNSVVDIWGNTNSVAVLQACTRKATNAEVALGGTSRTTNTVVALSLNVPGVLSLNEISELLNRF